MDLGTRDIVATWRRTGWAAKKSGELKVNRVCPALPRSHKMMHDADVLRPNSIKTPLCAFHHCPYLHPQKYENQTILLLTTALAVEGESYPCLVTA